MDTQNINVMRLKHVKSEMISNITLFVISTTNQVHDIIMMSWCHHFQLRWSDSPQYNWKYNYFIVKVHYSPPDLVCMNSWNLEVADRMGTSRGQYKDTMHQVSHNSFWNDTTPPLVALYLILSIQVTYNHIIFNIW